MESLKEKETELKEVEKKKNKTRQSNIELLRIITLILLFYYYLLVIFLDI